IYLMEAPHKDPVQEIANKIVFLRRALGMSAGEFARHLDISVRRLANIERGHRPVSLGLLLRMCHTFRKPMEYFIASTVVERPFYGIRRAKQVREGSRRSAVDADQGFGCFGDARLEALANGPPDRGMRPHLVRLSRRGARPAPLSQHAGQEFVYVLKGAVGLMTERDDGRLRETLFPGDSCFIDSSVPHRFVNARFNPYDGSGAEALAVSWSPPQGAS
ncbi:MAG: helix-turn-helix domain-containing protein, partial [Vicinamibacteraceae bacterium]